MPLRDYCVLLKLARGVFFGLLNHHDLVSNPSKTPQCSHLPPGVASYFYCPRAVRTRLCFGWQQSPAFPVPDAKSVAALFNSAPHVPLSVHVAHAGPRGWGSSRGLVTQRDVQRDVREHHCTAGIIQLDAHNVVFREGWWAKAWGHARCRSRTG